MGLGACASTEHAERYPASEPGAEAPRESAATVFALVDTSNDPQSAWLASRNDASLSPGPAHRSLPTSSWPNTGTRPESRRLPVIYSRWGRSF